LAKGALAAALVLLPWALPPVVPRVHPHAQWSDVLLALALLAWIPRLVESRKATHWVVAVVAYGSAALLSWIGSDRSIASLAHVAGIVSLGASALLVADVAGDEKTRTTIARAATCGTLAAALTGLIGAGLFFAGVSSPFVGTFGDLVPGPYPRIQGPSVHPNLLASLCLFGSAMATLCGWPKAVRIGTQVLFGVALLLTFSRTIVTFALALFLRSTRARPRTAIAATALAAFVVFAPTVVHFRVDPLRPWKIGVKPGLSPRAEGLVTSLVTFAANPLTGIGPGRAPGRSGGVPFDAHCTLVNVAATLGLPGLFAFVAVVVTLVRADRPQTGDPVWALLVALAVDSLAADVEDFRHVWIAMGLVAARDRPLTPPAGP
jgi:hypothetical protein